MFTKKQIFKVRIKEATPAAAAWVHIEEEKKSKKKQGHFPTSRQSPQALPTPQNLISTLRMRLRSDYLFIVLFIIFIQWSLYNYDSLLKHKTKPR